MDEVGAALIAIALVLYAVFVPPPSSPAFPGQFYRQFALTIAGCDRHLADRVADAVAGDVRAAAQAAQHADADEPGGSADLRLLPRLQSRLRQAHARLWLAVGQLVRFAAIMLVVYVGIIAFGLNEFRKTPQASSRSWTAAI